MSRSKYMVGLMAKVNRVTSADRFYDMGNILNVLESDMAFLYEEARNQVLKGDILEIGTGLGASTIVLAQALKDANRKEKVYTIDSFKEIGGQKEMAIGHIKNCGVEEYIQLIEGDSAEVLSSGSSLLPKVRMVFIDGGHLYETVKKDISLAFKYLAEGGIMAIHDYVDTAPQIIKAVEEYIKEGRLQGKRVSALIWAGNVPTAKEEKGNESSA